jgi:hypothetical protein
MRKGMLRAALALLVLGLWVGVASAAKITYTPLKSDTLWLYAADSSAVFPVENADLMWVTIIAPKLRLGDGGLQDTVVHHAATAYNGDSTATMRRLDSTYAMTTIRLAIQAREVMPRAAALDTSALYTMGGPNNNVPAAYSDTTLIPWPVTAVAGTAGTDSAAYNRRAPANTAAGSTEIEVTIPANSGLWSDQRSVRVYLVNTKTGMPFQAKFASFRWRLIAGPDPAKWPGRFRVVLGMKSW